MLNTLYQEIQNCHICPNMDHEKVLRKIEMVNLQSDVFIISQALASDQLRRSGINFLDINGRAGDTGKNLEKFLNRFNRTIYPKSLNSDFIPVYNSEITQCYPGKETKGDRKPTKKEIISCVNQKFLLREIEIIRPKLLLLMGKSSRDGVYNYILREKYPESLSEHISNIIDEGIPERILQNGIKLYILPIQHASGANINFHKMLENPPLIQSILKILT